MTTQGPTHDDMGDALKLCWMYGPQKPGMAKAIAALVEAAREQGRAEANAPIPPGHIKDDRGVVRRVLGTLATTDDGCVIGDDCKVWFQDQYVFVEVFRSPIGDEKDWWPFCIHDVYSTREAALAARGST